MYFALQQLHIQLEKILKQVTDSDKQTEEIKHALAFQSYIVHGNYHQVFRLRKKAPNMGIHLIDIFLPRLRKIALLKICKT